MKKILAGFLIIFGVFNLFAQSKITKEEYTVYSKIFKSLYEKRKVETDFQIVVLDNTIKKTWSSGLPESRIRGKFFTEQVYKEFGQQKIEELLKSYNENNSVSGVIKEKLKTKYM